MRSIISVLLLTVLFVPFTIAGEIAPEQHLSIQNG